MLDVLPAIKRGRRKVVARMQSGIFEALAELLFARDRLVAAAEYDDKETALERIAFARIQRCPDCSRHALPLLLQADAYDHQERWDGHAAALPRLDESAAYARGVSAEIEECRILAFPDVRRPNLLRGGRPNGGGAS